MGSLKRSLANNILTSGKFDATDLTGNLPSSNIANASMTSITAFPVTAGSAIALVASDPPSPTVGDTWFNTTTNTLKYAGVGVGSWASGGTMNSGGNQLSGAGTQTAGISSGGELGPPTTYGNSELYNGSAWTAGPALNTPRAQLTGSTSGTQTATMIALGRTAPGNVANAESFNGSTWTNLTSANTARRGNPGGAGIQTASLVFGGNIPPVVGNTESWNGSAWTETTDLNTARSDLAGVGLQTAALATGGTGPTGATEIWDGSTWTETTDLNTARVGVIGAGTNTTALAYGGYAPSGVTESWNGTSWTELNDLSTSRANLGGLGSSTAALAFGGAVSPTTITEEWTISPFTAKSVTTA